MFYGFLSEKPQILKYSHSKGMMLQCEHEHTGSSIFFGTDFWVAEQSVAKKESRTLHYRPHSLLPKHQALDTPLLIVLITSGSDISVACKELTDVMPDCYSGYQSLGPPWANNREWHEARIKPVYTLPLFL